jgi:hypothetical protein
MVTFERNPNVTQDLLGYVCRNGRFLAEKTTGLTGIFVDECGEGRVD